MPTEKVINDLVINKMTKAKYQELQSQSLIQNDELYFITDDDGKQDKLVGTPDQLVGFDENGNAVAVNSNTPKNSMILTDQETGEYYSLEIRSGKMTFKPVLGLKTLVLTIAPDKTVYYDGDGFDSTGMVITGISYDGTEHIIDDFTYEPKVVALSDTKITIMVKDSNILTVDVPITVNAFNPEAVLIDFTYTDNNDGTYTIIDWKDTLNGEASTEMIIPKNNKIIL